MNSLIGSYLYSLLKQITSYKQGDELEKKMKDLPYYDTLLTLLGIMSTSSGELNNKNKKIIIKLMTYSKKYMLLSNPKYLTPKELITYLPELTLDELLTELNWLYGMYI